MRYALAGLLALVIGSQADAQLIRRYARPAYSTGYSQSYYTSPSYASPGTVITSGYYSPYTYSSDYVVPSSYYSTPSVGFGAYPSYSNYGYSNYGLSNYGYSNYGYGNRIYGGRRGYRW
jgi:hypothetical protein